MQKPIKNISYILLLVFIVASCKTFLISDIQKKYKVENFCPKKELQNKGVNITSKGKLKALFIFVMFKDDTLTKSSSWKYDTNVLPSWASKLVNPSDDKKFPEVNLTHYFYEMSQGNFLLFGDVYPKIVIPDSAESKYKSIAQVNYEILKNLDDKIDYSKYDNWKRTQKGKFINEPDGNVDLVCLIYRNFANKLFYNQGWTGSAHFYMTKNIKTNDGVTINTGRLHKGSGIQQRGGKHGFDYTKYISAHEFAHFLFGGGHIRNTTNLSLLNTGPVWNESRGMHSWERERLGWINYTEVQLDKNLSFTLDDYITTGDVLRISLNKNEWYLVENHQKISQHDWAKDKGIYIYHIQNANQFPPRITIECADGNWDFNIDTKTKTFKKSTPNRKGKNETNFSQRKGKTNYACYKQVYGDNSAWGDKFDAFDLTYNNVFSPVSNPSSKNITKKDFAIEIKEKVGHKISLNIYFKDIYKNTSPSKPQIVGIENIQSKKPTLKWLPNEEPDLNGYTISFVKPVDKIIGDVKKTSIEIELVDLNLKVENLISVSSFDIDNNSSLQSNLISIKWNNTKKEWNYTLLERN